MSSRKLIVLLAFSIAIPMLAPASLSAQGILRRLRDRIAVPPPFPVPTPRFPGARLPARPYPTQQSPANTAAKSPVQSSEALRQRQAAAARANASPSARYQVPPSSVPRSSVSSSGNISRNTASPVVRVPAANQVRIPAAPTPAPMPSGIAQASASEPASAGQAVSGRPSFGKSILKPFGFDDSSGTSNAAVAQSTIGIQGSNANPGYPGVEVKAFRDHSMADESGLRVGDFIFGVNGVATPSLAELVKQVAKYQPGENVRLRIGRDGRVSDLEIQLVSRPTQGGAAVGRSDVVASKSEPVAGLSGDARSFSGGPKIGADVRDVDGTRGVVVTNVSPGSLAEAGGLKIQDRIVAIDGRMIANTSDLISRIKQLSSGDEFDLKLVRGGQLVDARIPGSVPTALPTEVAGFQPTSEGSPTIAANSSGQLQGTESSSQPEQSGSGGSLLGGLSSMLGGVFGGSTPADSAEAPLVSESLSAPTAELLPPQESIGADIEPVDVLALEPPTGVKDESGNEPVGVVSVDGATGEKAEKGALKLEIERLKMQLKRLEKKVAQ